MHRVSKKYIIIAPITLFLIYSVFHPARVLSSAQELYNKWMVLTMILDKVERFYVDETDPDELLRNAIDGMLSGLDPHSVYIGEEQYKAFAKAYEGYFGVGIKYNIIGNQFVVTNVMENGPAAIAGVLVGDRLVKIEGVPVNELKVEQIERILSGSEEKTVTLQIARPNSDDLLTFELPKRQIEHKSVPIALMLDEQTGYIKISNFTETTPTEFDSEYAQLKKSGIKRLVLDLRNNGGGAFDAGVAIADRFLSGGKMIVFTKGRALSSSQQYIATSSQTVSRDPLIVLVNEATASDAEIVAGAIQDWDRGLIVGRRTFGKALVQTEFPFQDGSVLLLTTARYYTPLGRLIQSDYYVNPSQKLKDEEYRFKKYKTPQGRLVFGGGGIRPDVILEKQSVDIPAVIKQLYLSDNDLLFKYVDSFVSAMPEEQRTMDLNEFLHKFQVTEEMLNEFYQLLTTENVQIKLAEVKRYPGEIKKALKIEIAWRLWGEKGRYAIASFYDAEIMKSLSYFAQASTLLVRQ